SRNDFGGEGGKKVRCRIGIIGQEPEYLSDPPHSVVAVALIAASGINDPGCNRKNFFAKRRMRAGRCGHGHTSPTLRVGGNLLCKIVQSGWFRVAHLSRVFWGAQAAGL